MNDYKNSKIKNYIDLKNSRKNIDALNTPIKEDSLW